MHLLNVNLFSEQYPTRDHYPFDLDIFHQTKQLEFTTPVTFFAGENGTGKSTLLEAISLRCGIHIWENEERLRFTTNPYEDKLYQCISIQWANGPVPGSFFGSHIFRHFAQLLDEWAAGDPGLLKYFGGQSLMTQSHGQSLMSFFKARYTLRGVYFLDEPETALSPKSQIELLQILHSAMTSGNAQFIIATHSPILLACPNAVIYNFDQTPINKIEYEQTDYYRVYKDFMVNRSKFLNPGQAVSGKGRRIKEKK